LLFSKIVCPDEWMIAGAVAAEVEAARGEFDDDALCEEAAAPRLIINFLLTLVLTNNYIIIVSFVSLSLRLKILVSPKSRPPKKNTKNTRKRDKNSSFVFLFFRPHKNKSSSPKSR
jgi:hypothetical protein